MKRAVVCVLALVVACVVGSACTGGGGASETPPAQTETARVETPPADTAPAPAETPSAAEADVSEAAAQSAAAAKRPRLVSPMKGTAVIEVLRPVVKVVGKEVVTTLRIRNMSYGPVAGLRVDEYWYDKQGNLLPGDTYRHKTIFMPDEEITVELRTPRDPRMDRNSYQFTHANGKVRADTVAKFSPAAK
jgi:hypothetical protein